MAFGVANSGEDEQADGGPHGNTLDQVLAPAYIEQSSQKKTTKITQMIPYKTRQ